MSYEPQYSLEHDDDHPDNWSRKNEFSGVLAPLYTCPQHGEVYHVQMVGECDPENDEVYEHPVCSYCGASVTPILHDGIPVCHPLTVEELYWDSYGEDEDEDEDEWMCDYD